jgi:hypothetical protein
MGKLNGGVFMKKIFTVIMLLAGSLAAVALVLQKMGKLSSVLEAHAGAYGVIGKDDAPTAVFAITKTVPLFIYNFFIRLFGDISVFSSASLLHHIAKRNDVHPRSTTIADHDCEGNSAC